MYVSAINQSQYHAAAVSFLTGTGKLDDAFNFTLINGNNAAQKTTALAFPGGWFLSVRQRRPRPPIKRSFFTWTRPPRRCSVC